MSVNEREVAIPSSALEPAGSQGDGTDHAPRTARVAIKTLPDRSSEPPSGNRLLRTGIRGFDDVLGGGLPAQRLYLVEGAPGSGKTTLSLQFLLEGRERGEAGLYVTLSETSDELDEVARSHGWTLEGIDLLDMSDAPDVARPEAQYTVFHPSEVELQDTVDRILGRVRERRPTRVVLDSLSEMRLLARDPLRFRRQILALKRFFAESGATVLLLDDETTGDLDKQLHSLAHGVVRLEQMSLSHGAERRQIRVSKLRAMRFHGGFHDFVIRSGGIEVFPRVRMSSEALPARKGVIPSGSPELDKLTGGGLVYGTSALVVGAPGTGKSVLCTEFANAAAARGESVAVYLFDERIGTFLERAAGLDLHLAPHLEAGRITLTALEPTEISPGEFASRVIGAVNDDGVSLVIIDSLNGFMKAMAEERQITAKIHELLSYLGSRSVTTLLTLAQHGVFGASPDNIADVSYLADAVVLLRYFEALGEVKRAMSVVKQRSSAHETTIREFRIGRGGVQLGAPLRDFQGVLTGVPTYTGGGGALMLHATLGDDEPEVARA